MDALTTRKIHFKKPGAIAQAAATLEDGGVVAFPTETVYGLAALATDGAACDRLDAIKSRDHSSGWTLHLDDPTPLAAWAGETSSDLVRRLAGRLMPGPVTFWIDVDPTPPESWGRAGGGYSKQAWRAICGEGRLAVRCPDHPAAMAMLAAVDAPVVAVSAAHAGKRPARDASSVVAALAGEVDLVVDGGPARYGKPSTIIRITAGRAIVVRPGIYDQSYIDRMARKRIVFVCTGNTCRSPMAAAIARHQIASSLGIAADELDEAGWAIDSAGVFAAEGAPMTAEARRALEAMGIEAPRHRSRGLKPELLRDADHIFTLTQSHADAIRRLAPDVSEKVRRLAGDRDIADPVGRSQKVYQRCAESIREHVKSRLDELGV